MLLKCKNYNRTARPQPATTLIVRRKQEPSITVTKLAILFQTLFLKG